MRGVLWGTLVLIVVETLVQPSAASKVGTASNIFVAALRRLSDPAYGGIPNVAKGTRPPLVSVPTSPARSPIHGLSGPVLKSVN